MQREMGKTVLDLKHEESGKVSLDKVKAKLAEGKTVRLTQADSLRLIRLELGLTQAEVGQKARINDSKLSLFENGLFSLTEAELKRLQIVLKASMKRLSKRKKAVNYDELKQRRFARRSSGISQRKLALAAKIPRKRLIYWEAGRLELSPEEKGRWEKAVAGIKHDDPWFLIKEAVLNEKEMIRNLEKSVERNFPGDEEVKGAQKRWLDAQALELAERNKLIELLDKRNKDKAQANVKR